MRQNLSRGVVLAAAATGIMSLYASPAFADSSTTATASDSPGVASGNNVQVPVNVPLNICGNTVDAVAALNPAFGNSCANGPVAQGRHAAPHHPVQHDAGSAHRLGRGTVHGGTDHARGHGGHPAGHGAEHNGGHAGQPAGLGGERGGQSGLGSELGGLGDLGGYVGELGGYGDSGYGDVRQGHSGYGDSGYGDVRQVHSDHMSPGHRDSAAHHGGWSGASSYGSTHGSPGVLSGDQAALPVDIPLELCGNTLDVIGLLNPVLGNTCAHHDAPHSHPATPHHCPPTPPRTVPQPPKHHTPPVKVHEQPPVPRQYTPPTLAETGSEGMLANGAISAALLVGGALLYRRSRAMSRP
ncbi:chaplin [Streptomyces sp. NPDC059371]|uniref:chaplin n=1 Tax=Streptomyces sp. NPDC059371 TaxID=3346812 RepID=UPI0036BFB14B